MQDTPDDPTQSRSNSENIAAMFAKTFPAKKKVSPPSKAKEDSNAQVKTKKRKKVKNDGKKPSKDSEKERRVLDPEQEKRTVFVGNLPTSTTKKQLLKLFIKFGRIQSARFRSATSGNPKLTKKATVITRDFHPDKPCINAYVVFADVKSVEDAISLNGHILDGRHIRVDRAVREKLKHDHSVFVGNLPLDVQEEDLRSHFESCGDVDNTRIVRDAVTGLGKGFGYILFHDKDSVAKALQLNDKEFNNRKIRVMKSVKKPKKNKLRGKSKTGKRGDKGTSKKFAGKGTSKKFKGKKRQTENSEKVESRRGKKYDKELREAFRARKEGEKKNLRNRIQRKRKETIANILMGTPKKKKKSK